MTFVRDIADKALFGSRASGGVINITTRRGHPGERRIRVGFRKRRERGGPQSRVGQRRRIRAVAESGAHQQRICAALLQRNDRRVHAPRCEQPHGAERRLPQSDVQGHETLLQGQRLVRRRVGTARIQHLPGVCRRRDIFKVGSTADFNRLTVRTHLNAAITRDLKIDFGFAGGLELPPFPRYGNSGAASATEFDNASRRGRATPAIEFPLIVSHDETTGNKIYGVSQNYRTNPYAALTENGFSPKGPLGSGQRHTDLRPARPGQRAEVPVLCGTDLFNMTRIGKNPTTRR